MFRISSSTSNRLARWEPWLLMALAFLLRAAFINRVAVEHFDEGVYASGYFAEHLDYRYPDLHLYAPPLLPAILRSVLYFSGGNPHAVVWVDVVAGSLLVGAVWLLTRDWFGREAALAAGILMATSEFAILYSRAVLTDTLLCLWLTLGVWAGWRAITGGGRGGRRSRGAATQDGPSASGCGSAGASPSPTPSPPRSPALHPSVLAGAFAALAWWTKYNGWLTLAITGAGTIGWIVFERPGWRASQFALGRWLGTAVIALLLWSPVPWMLQAHGGYAAVAANHAGYFGGFGNWWESAVRQVQVEGYLDGIVLLIGFVVLTVGTIMVHGVRDFRMWLWGGLISVAALGVWMGTGHGALLLAMWALYSLAVLFGSTSLKAVASLAADDPNAKAASEWRLQWRMTAWMAFAWFAGLTLAIPLYRPYPRLLLPWIVIVMCCVGRGLVVVFWAMKRTTEEGREHKGTVRWVVWVGAFAVLCGLLMMFAHARPSFHFVAWQPRTGLRDAAGRVLDDLPAALADRPPSPFEEADCVLYVLGEPGLYYHLAAQQGRREVKHVAQPASNLGMLRPGSTAAGLPAFLVTGLHAHRDHPELLSNPPAGLTLIGEYPYLASDLVLLDDMPPSEVVSHRQQGIRFWLIEVAEGGTERRRDRPK